MAYHGSFLWCSSATWVTWPSEARDSQEQFDSQGVATSAEFRSHQPSQHHRKTSQGIPRSPRNPKGTMSHQDLTWPNARYLDQLWPTHINIINLPEPFLNPSPVICHHSSDLRRPDGGLRAAETWGPSNRSRPVCKARSKLLISTWRGAAHNQKQVGTFQNQNNMVDGYSNFIKQPKSNWWLNNVEQCWTMLNNVERCWTMLNNVEQCWTMLNNVERCWTMLNNVEQCWTMLNNVEQCWTMLNDVEQCWTMLNNVEQCWTMLNDVEQCWTMLNNVEQCWTMLNNVE